MAELDKELALAIDFKKAPVELQNAATAHYANVKAVAKLSQKIVDTNKELEAAEAAAEETAKALRAGLKKWNPEV